jgi:hypothetical protein
MGEPSREASLLPKGPLHELHTLLQHEHPGACCTESNGQWVVYTLHSVGQTEEEAITNAVADMRRMKEDGRSVRQMLDDILEDLNTRPGMSKSRHQSLTELIQLASAGLNDGAITKTIPWIQIPSLTREITELQRRVDMRLAMTAKEMKDAEDAKKRAGIKFPHRDINRQPSNPLPGQDVPGAHKLSTMEQVFSLLKQR